MKKGLSLSIAMLAGTLAGAPALAGDNAALLESIRAQAGEYDEFKALLNSPEQSTRVAAFDAMTGSGDRALRELAIDSALANVDATMQSLALNAVLDGMETLVFKLELSGGASDVQKSNAAKWGGSFNVDLKGRAEDGGLQCRKTIGTGNADCHVSGTRFSYTGGHCRVEAELDGGDSLIGELSCFGGSWTMDPVKVTARLR